MNDIASQGRSICISGQEHFGAYVNLDSSGFALGIQIPIHTSTLVYNLHLLLNTCTHNNSPPSLSSSESAPLSVSGIASKIKIIITLIIIIIAILPSVLLALFVADK